MTAGFNEQRTGELLSRAEVPDTAELRAVVQALGQSGLGQDPERIREVAERLGTAGFRAGEDPGMMVQRVLRIGRAWTEAMLAANAIDAQQAEAVTTASGDIAAAAVSAHVRIGHEHREAWLSHLCHDLKNPLNTLLNALWLIREHRASGNIDRFIELAERAVRRLTTGVKDIRELQDKERELPAKK